MLQILRHSFVLVCVNVFTTAEDDSVILTSLPPFHLQGSGTEEFDPKCWSPLSGLGVELRVAVGECGKEWKISLAGSSSRYATRSSGYGQSRNSAFSCSLLNFEYRCMETMDTNFAPRHRPQLGFELVSVVTKCPDDPRIRDGVEWVDGSPVTHHTGNGPAESLSAKRGPKPSTKRGFWGGTPESETVEGEVICLGDLLVAKQSGSIVHHRFSCKDFWVVDEIVPLNVVHLPQVLEKCSNPPCR